MIILPRLQKKIILIAVEHISKEEGSGIDQKGGSVSIQERSVYIQKGMKEVEVEIWGATGLAIHEYRDMLYEYGWRITHVPSGRSILKYLPTRDHAIDYMMKLYRFETIEKIRIDWCMGYEEIRNVYYREEIIGMLKGLQQEINNKGNEQ